MQVASRRYGRTPRPVLDRYLEKVDRSGGVDACWPWTSGLDKDGYGQLKIGSRTDNSRRTVVASRLGHELLVGPVPEDQQVLHHCDNPSCQNPTHWFLGTNADNMADKAVKKRVIIRQGIENPMGKVTDEQVQEIRLVYGQGLLTLKMVGDLFGLSRQHTGDIVSGRYR